MEVVATDKPRWQYNSMLNSSDVPNNIGLFFLITEGRTQIVCWLMMIQSTGAISRVGEGFGDFNVKLSLFAIYENLIPRCPFFTFPILIHASHLSMKLCNIGKGQGQQRVTDVCVEREWSRELLLSGDTASEMSPFALFWVMVLSFVPPAPLFNTWELAHTNQCSCISPSFDLKRWFWDIPLEII